MKLLRKLTIKNLLMNRTRTIVTIIGIILSAALIMTVISIMTSARKSLDEATVVANGDYEFFLYGDFNKDDLTTFRNNRSVKDVYSFEELYTAKLAEPKYTYSNYMFILGTNAETLRASRCKLAEGRFPENENEILLSEDTARYSEKKYSVGEVIELETGRRLVDPDSYAGKTFIAMSGSAEIPFGIPGVSEEERWETTEKKKYTVVGILSATNGIFKNQFYGGVPAYTYKDIDKTKYAFIDLWENCEKDYRSVISQITGLDEQLIKDREEYNNIDETDRKMTEALAGNPDHIMNFYVNRALLSFRGYVAESSPSRQITIGIVMAVAVLIVMFASAFIIRNSFAISITEKLRMYGMLASVGATPRQIKHNVYFEAFLLGIVGIPLGILLGAGVSWALVAISGTLLGSLLGSFELMLDIPFYAVLLTVGVSVVTIILASATAAVRASRTSPLEAIRSNNYVNISKRQLKKGYPTPKWVRKLFGIGGSIAWKSAKRNRKQYRTTVISIVVSVALFLTVSSVVQFAIRLIEKDRSYLIANSEYNLIVNVNGEKYEKKDEKTDTLLYTSNKLPAGRVAEYIDKIAADYNFGKYRYSYASHYYTFSFDDSQLTDELKSSYAFTAAKAESATLNFSMENELLAVDKKTFMQICDNAGLAYEDCKDKGFIWNNLAVHYDENGKELRDPILVPLLAKPEGTKIHGEYHDYEYEYDYSLPEEEFDAQEPKITEINESVDIELAGIIEEIPVSSSIESTYAQNNVIIVTDETFEKLCELPGGAEVDISTSDPNGLSEKLNEAAFSEDSPISHISNFAYRVEQARSVVLLVQIFVYGFIAVIILIGVTNLFNTVTTSMKFRQKEFAMLRSVGTTNKELHRMILLESALYTIKSLIIGIPIGILAGFTLCWLFGESIVGKYGDKGIYYQVPWMGILICTLCVLLLLFTIMRVSISKFNKQNIIETIRNDNI